VPIPIFKSSQRIPVNTSNNMKKGHKKSTKEFRHAEKGTNQLMLWKLLQSQMKFKSYLSTLQKNFKNEYNIKGTIKKLRFTSILSNKSGYLNISLPLI